MEYRFKADEWNALTPAERVRRCLLWAVEAQEIADNSPPKLAATYQDIADQWAKLAEEIEELAQLQSETRADAVGDFFKQGGKVEKLQATVSVSASEVVAYLAGRGINVKYSGTSQTYVYERKRLSLAHLVRLANVHRRAENLPPFAATINIHVGRKS